MSNMIAIVVRGHGGPEVLQLGVTTRPAPEPGEALVRLTYAPVNMVDVYYRSGQYEADLPFIPGMEGFGVVEAVGTGVADIRPGQRVGYAMHPGSYAQFARVPAWKLLPVPDGLDDQCAAAALLQGLTAHFLAHDTWALSPGQTALVHAAAGGVGALLTQMLKRRGVRVIGVVSTEVKARHARECGADDIILRSDGGPFAPEVSRRTAGRGVDVVFDSVGRMTFEESLDCLRPRGCLILYGQSSGPAPPFDPQVLRIKGSLFLTRPTLTHYMADRTELLGRAADLFNWLTTGALRVRIDAILPLEDATRAHRHLEERRSHGKILLELPR
ncbi:MAG: quinone oxidoreductase [Isosphaeraceae bacterium]